jgi:hypothetical protein
VGTQGLLLEIHWGVMKGGRKIGERAEKRELGTVVCLRGSTDRDSLPLGRSYGVESRRAFRHRCMIG